MAAYECKWMGDGQTSFLASLASTVLVGNIIVMERHTVVGTNLVFDPHSDL